MRMPRKPRIDPTDDGGAALRLRVGPHTLRLAEAFAQRFELQPPRALEILLGQVEALIKTRSTAWLSADWQELARMVERLAPPVALTHIDLTKLHRSEKTNSGFVGVYANGRGFRAAGPHGAHVGQYELAEEAAWARYLYYKQRNLPYGQMEIDIAAMRQRGEVGSDGQLAALVLETAQHTATMHWYSAEEVAWAEAAAAKAEAEGKQPYVPPEGGLKMTGLEDGLEEALARLRKHDASTPE